MFGLNIFELVIIIIAIIFIVTWIFGVRTHIKRGRGIQQQTLNTILLFIVSLLLTIFLKISPLHLLWMFPTSWILGVLSIAFPLSLLSIPGKLIRFVSCIGLDMNEMQRRRELVEERVLKMMTLSKEKDISMEEAREILIESGEWGKM